MLENTVLVTGGAGYIGSHVCLSLLDAGWGVVVVDDLSTGNRDLVPDGAVFIEGDIGDRETAAGALADHRCRAVMHFAGSTIVPESVAEPLKYYRNNTCASRTLLDACVAAGVEGFIFSSTAAVYGNPETLPVDEDAELRPITPYGTSKLMTEWMLRDVSAATSMRTVALRYFNVAGADPGGRSGQSTPNATHLIKVACETACGKRDTMTIFGDDYDTPDGTCIRDFIHVTDLADAHVAGLNYLMGGGASAVMNCGYGRGFSVRQVIDTVEEVSGRPLPVTVGPRRTGDIAQIFAVTNRVREALDWTPRLDDLRTIVASAYAWESRTAPSDG